MTETLVELRDVEFAYRAGSFAMQVPTLDIARGERVACIGPSGSGKTTLINLISGIAVPRKGSVRVGDDVVSRLGDGARRALRSRRIGMVFQEFELLEYLTALENILLPYHVSSDLVLDATARDRARTVAEALSITHVLGRRPRRLSQGERQRVAIARALVTEPGLVICDEPTGNLDPATAGAMLDLLFDHAHRAEATLLVVTHDRAILDRFDRVVDMTSLVAGGRA